jgi:hypothetical protein
LLAHDIEVDVSRSGTAAFHVAVSINVRNVRFKIDMQDRVCGKYSRILLWLSECLNVIDFDNH